MKINILEIRERKELYKLTNALDKIRQGKRAILVEFNDNSLCYCDFCCGSLMVKDYQLILQLAKEQ